MIWRWLKWMVAYAVCRVVMCVRRVWRCSVRGVHCRWEPSPRVDGVYYCECCGQAGGRS